MEDGSSFLPRRPQPPDMLYLKSTFIFSLHMNHESLLTRMLGYSSSSLFFPHLHLQPAPGCISFKAHIRDLVAGSCLHY